MARLLQWLDIEPTRTSLVLHILGFLLGVSLVAGKTSLAPFEILVVLIALLYTWHTWRRGVYTVARTLWQAHASTLAHRALAGFALLILLQILWAPAGDISFLITTLYLIGVYALIVVSHIALPLILGYLAGALGIVCASVLAYSIAAHRGAPLEVLFWHGDVRIVGFFDDPVVFGAYVVPLFLAAGTVSVLPRVPRSVRFSAILALLFSIVTLIATGSRGHSLQLRYQVPWFPYLYGMCARFDRSP